MKVSLQPVIVSYTSDDNSSCSCQGECAEDIWERCGCCWRRCVCFAQPLPGSSSYLRTQADVTHHLWHVQVNYVPCVMRSSVYATKVPSAGIDTDIAGTDHREVKHLNASTSPVFQGPSYNLSSHTAASLY